MSKLYTLMYKRAIEAIKVGERKVEIELPLMSIDSKYSLEGCYNYMRYKLEENGYRTRFKLPNKMVIYTRRELNRPYSAPAALGENTSKPNKRVSEKTKATARPLKKTEITARVKRQTEKIKGLFPNIEKVEYYRVE